jgi:hypothetical protein
MAERLAIQLGLRGTFARMRRARLQARTERVLDALPEHIRRDIGWLDGSGLERIRKG